MISQIKNTFIRRAVLSVVAPLAILFAIGWLAVQVVAVSIRRAVPVFAKYVGEARDEFADLLVAIRAAWAGR